jgi:hypothetical protein
MGLMGNPISKKIIGGWNMNQKIACYLVLCLVSAGIIALFPTAAAQPYGGSVTISDGTNIKDYFDLGEEVFFDVYATDDGIPLQGDINISIVDSSGVEYHEGLLSTDQFGFAKGSWPYTYTANKYTIYANYSGINIANTTFRVYNPIPHKATVMTYANDYRDSGGTPALYFNTNELVYFSVYIEDQYGHPFTDDDEPDDEIDIKIEHNGEANIWGENFLVGNNPYIDGIYLPSSDFSKLEEQYGSYFINVTNYPGESIGNTTFYVIDVDIVVTPYKTQYIQGDEITIFIETSIDDTIDVRIIDSEDDDILNANWTDQPVVNGQWTKEYTLPGNLPDANNIIKEI